MPYVIVITRPSGGIGEKVFEPTDQDLDAMMTITVAAFEAQHASQPGGQR